jgi:competence protein ComEA
MKTYIINLLEKTYIKYVAVLLIIVLSGTIYILSNVSGNDENLVFASDININNEEDEPPLVEVIETIYVDVKGAVKKPGVYELKSTERVNDAVLKSGGLKETADTSIINLSKRLTDEMVIIVYTKEEVKKMTENNPIIKYIDKECQCPEITNQACINNNEQSNDIENKTKISLNNATLEQLQTLPGIGSSKAIEIVNYRDNNGGFKSIDELKEISGIGSATFEKLKDLVTI